MYPVKVQPKSRILLIGAGGKTGIAYAKLLLQHGHILLAYDKNPAFQTKELEIMGNVEKASEADYVSGKILEKCEYVTLSPGVSLGLPIFQHAREYKKEIFSELEYASPYLPNRKIAITGTDGKSTVTALINHILNHAGFGAVACGNFGIPYSQLLLENISPDVILVTELSSYQLELSRNFHPQVSVYLNLAPDHLDRYSSLENYGLVKWNVIQNQGSGDFLVVNENLLPMQNNSLGANHPYIKRQGISVCKVFAESLVSDHFRIANDNLLQTLSGKSCSLKNFSLTGKHNLSNLLFALEAVVACTNASTEELLQGLASFQGLPHRFERLHSLLPHTFINDSKATTTQACITAIKNAPENLLVFLGGQGKGETYTEVGKVLLERNAHAFLYGSEAEKMAGDFTSKGFENFSQHDTLARAFSSATAYAENIPGKNFTFLLSPAATSWDQYNSFEERGNHFRTLVKEYSEKSK